MQSFHQKRIVAWLLYIGLAGRVTSLKKLSQFHSPTESKGRESNMPKNKTVTIEDFESWLESCPVPYEQTDNGLNTTESYDFDLLNVDWSSKHD